MHKATTIRYGFIALALAMGCAGRSSPLAKIADVYQPDLERARARASTIVFVPGIMGSELHDSRDGHVVWGTFWSGGAWEDTLRDLALPFAVDRPVSQLRDSLVPGGELLVVDLALPSGPIHARAYPGSFEGLVKSLLETGTHHAPEALSIEDAMAGRDPIIGFGYDWRRDIASEARRLHEVVVAASEERRLRTGNSRIDIVAHSMGTQVVRWYLQYGTAPVPADGSLPELTWAGVRYVERVLLVAAPNLGEARALEVMLHGAQEHPLLPKYPPAVLATFPAAFQILPRPRDHRVIWADNGEPVDLYDVAVWESLKWGPFADDQDEALRALLPEVETRTERLALLRKHMAACLEHARRFHEALDRPAPPPPEVRIHSFVGDRHPTPAVLHVNRRNGKVKWARAEPGDGTATRTSALGQSRFDRQEPPTITSHSVHFSGAEHLPIVGDPSFLNQALYLLLEEPDPPAPELTVSSED